MRISHLLETAPDDDDLDPFEPVVHANLRDKAAHEKRVKEARKTHRNYHVGKAADQLATINIGQQRVISKPISYKLKPGEKEFVFNKKRYVIPVGFPQQEADRLLKHAGRVVELDDEDAQGVDKPISMRQAALTAKKIGKQFPAGDKAVIEAITSAQKNKTFRPHELGYIDDYITRAVHGPSSELEPHVLKFFKTAFDYVQAAYKGKRWGRYEMIIENGVSGFKEDSPIWAHMIAYAVDRNFRWPTQTEQHIVRCRWDDKVYQYMKVVKGRWAPFEMKMLSQVHKDSRYSGVTIDYAVKYMGGSWPQLEHKILNLPVTAFMGEWAHRIKNGRWPNAEGVLKDTLRDNSVDLDAATAYASPNEHISHDVLEYIREVGYDWDKSMDNIVENSMTWVKAIRYFTLVRRRSPKIEQWAEHLGANALASKRYMVYATEYANANMGGKWPALGI